MAERKLAVKYSADGYQAVLEANRRVAQSFDKSLQQALETIKRANNAILISKKLGDETSIVNADRLRAQAAKQANTLIQNSYRELRLKSTHDLDQMRKQAISAFKTIRDSGVRSAQDVANAQIALDERLRDIEKQYVRTARGAREYSASLEQMAIKANKTIQRSNRALDYAPANSQAQRAAAEVRARAVTRRDAVADEAFSRLGVRSRASIEAERKQLVDAFNAIKKSGVASAQDIAIAQRKLKQEMAGLSQEARGQERTFSDVGTSLKDVVKSFAGYTAQAAQFAIVFGAINQISQALTAAIAAPFVAVDVYKDYELSLKAIQVASKGSNEEIKALGNTITAIAPKIGQLPQNTAALALELTRAGYSAEQVAAQLKNIGNEALATGEDLSTVGKITSSSIKQFGIAVEDYEMVADVLVSGANESAAGISSIGEALKYVGPQANQANQSFADTVAAVALLTDAGLEGSIAGTSLGQALDRLKLSSAGLNQETAVTTRGVKTASQALAELGVQVRDANGEMRPFVELVPELRAAFNKLSKEDKDIIMKVLFGTEGARSVNALLARTDEDIAQITKTIRESQGAAEAAGAAMLNTYGGTLQQLSAQAQSFQQKLGEAFAPAFRAGAQELNNLLSEVIDTDRWFEELNRVALEFVDYLRANPEIMREMKAELKELIDAGFRVAVTLLAEMLSYLKRNPEQIQLMVSRMGEFLNNVNLVVGGFVRLVEWAQKYYDLLRKITEFLPGNYIANKAREAILSRGTPQTQGSGDEIKVGPTVRDAQGRIKARPVEVDYDTLYGHRKVQVVDRSGLPVVNVRPDGLPNALDPEAAQALEKLMAEARRQGITLALVDAHRTYEEQAGLFNSRGGNKAAAYSTAPPGYSEHHTGFGFDLGTPDGQLIREGSPEAEFLRKNAGRFGLRQSFTGSADIMAEPWHFRYEGSERAKQILNLSSGGSSSGTAFIDHGGSDHSASATAKKEGQQFLGVQGRTGLAANNSSQSHVHYEGPPSGLEAFIARAQAAGLKVFAPSGKEINSIKDLEPHWDGKKQAWDLFLEGAPYDRSVTGVPVPFPFFGQSQVVDIQSGGRGGNAVVVKELATGQTAYLAHFSEVDAKVGDVSADGEGADRFKFSASLYDDAQQRMEQEERKQRQLLEDARRRQDEYRQQQNEQAKQVLADRQKRARLALEQQAITASDPQRMVIEKRLEQLAVVQQHEQDILEIEQTLAQLQEERARKVADQGTDESLTGRDITDEINFLKERKKYLEGTKNTELMNLKLTFGQALNDQYRELQTQLVGVDQMLAELNGQFARSPVADEAEQVRALNAEFDGYKQSIVEVIKATVDLIEARTAAGVGTEKELALLERLKTKYLEVQDIQNRVSGDLTRGQDQARRQRELTRAQEIGGVDSQLRQAYANVLDSRGEPFTANRVRRNDAIAQERLRAEQEMFDIEIRLTEARATLSEAMGRGEPVGELQDEVTALEQIQAKTAELNSLKLDGIKEQFESLEDVLVGIGQDAFGGFVEDIFSGAKSVKDAFLDMVKSILQSLGRLAAQMFVQKIFGLFTGGADFGGAGIGALVGGGLRFAKGGKVRGPGTGTSDSIRSWLSNNEYVINAEATEYWGDRFLADINARRMPIPLLNEGSDAHGTSQGSVVINQHTTVVTPNADSFRVTKYQRDLDQAEAVRRALARG